jgi:hypothetical protein
MIEIDIGLGLALYFVGIMAFNLRSQLRNYTVVF